jgi:hypothetical protein
MLPGSYLIWFSLPISGGKAPIRHPFFTSHAPAGSLSDISFSCQKKKGNMTSGLVYIISLKYCPIY